MKIYFIQMKHTLPTLCILLLATMTARANGDPVAVHSALTLSPTPVAVHVPEVQLVDEVVSFVPRDRYMEVTVRYLLHNRSSRNFDKLPYGFPIDYFGSGKARWEGLDDYSESQQEVGWRDGYIRNVSFTLGEKQLTWQCSRDSIIVPKELTPDFEFLDYKGEKPDSADSYSQEKIKKLYAKYGDHIYSNSSKPIFRRWYYTYFNIPANSFAILEVRYTVECPWDGTCYPRNNNLTDNIYLLSFQYDFSPAAYWGDGHADHFFVTLDVSGINLQKDMQSFSKDHFNYKNGFNGLPLQQKGKMWQYETRHFDLAASKPFRVFYRLNNLPQQPLERILNHRIDTSAYTITVSGADKKYPAANLSDLDPATACVLRPDKNDSIFITIRFKKPTILEGMLLMNGYTKNAESYRNNSRIDSLLIYGNFFDTYKDEKGKIDTTTYKNDMLFNVEYEHWSEKWADHAPVPSKYPEKNIKSFDWQTIVDNALILRISDNPWYDTHYTEIRIIITAATKGLKYSDLCVSEILLIGK